MKILFFISAHGHGEGGHAYSLSHISKKISENHDVKIILIGPGSSKIIEANPNFLCHINYKGYNFLKLRKKILTESEKFKPDIFHCFDVGCYNVVRLIKSSKKNKIVLNKCGGANPKNFSYVKNLVLFSQENVEWFNTQRKFSDSNINLIPNRVNPIQLDKSRMILEKEDDFFTFVRICRIGKTYKKSIENAINLISILLSKNIKNVRLYVIGTVQEQEIFNDLIKHTLVDKGYVIFLTTDEYTIEASQMLYLADAVVGTGRGLMEAASLKKPILAIDKNRNIPVLLDDKLFFQAFRTNFSERNDLSMVTEDDNINSIISLLNDKKVLEAKGLLSFNFFNQYFSIDKVLDQYTKVYSGSGFSKKRLLKDWKLILRRVLSFFKSSLKS